MTVYSDGTAIVDASPIDPGDKDSFGFDWSDRLATGETITASAWTLSGGLTEDSSSNTTTVTSVTVTGAALGVRYDLTNEITTSNGLILNRTMRTVCKNK